MNGRVKDEGLIFSVNRVGVGGVIITIDSCALPIDASFPRVKIGNVGCDDEG